MAICPIVVQIFSLRTKAIPRGIAWRLWLGRAVHSPEGEWTGRWVDPSSSKSACWSLLWGQDNKPPNCSIAELFHHGDPRHIRGVNVRVRQCDLSRWNPLRVLVKTREVPSKRGPFTSRLPAQLKCHHTSRRSTEYKIPHLKLPQPYYLCGSSVSLWIPKDTRLLENH